MRRREFITLLGGTATAWPLVARAQQSERMRRIGVLMKNLAADDPEGLARVTAFAQGLQQLGWTDGRNVRIDARWAAGNADNFRKYAAELVALAPDVFLAIGTPAVVALQQATHTVATGDSGDEAYTVSFELKANIPALGGRCHRDFHRGVRARTSMA